MLELSHFLIPKLLQSHNNQNSVVRASSQTYRPMKLIESPEKLTQTNFFCKCQDHSLQRTVFPKKQCWEKWIFTCSIMKLDPFLIPYTKINSKSVKNLCKRAKTIQFFEDNIGEKLYDILCRNDFLYMTPKARATTTTKRKQINWTTPKLKTVHQGIQSTE